MNKFYSSTPVVPNESCHSYLQVSVEPSAGVMVKVDPAYMPEGFPADVQFVSLASERPVTSQCPAMIDQGERIEPARSGCMPFATRQFIDL